MIRGIEQILKSIFLIVLISCSGANQAWSQLYPLGAQYFHNQYLGNPSSAGIDSGYRFDLSNRVQWNDVPGAPVSQVFTGVIKTGKVGLGLNLTKEKEGLMNSLRTVATLAYHLPLKEDQQLHFGLSVGMLTQRIRTEDIVGNEGDPSVSNYNNREFFLDGDYGMAYTNDKLKVQLAIPNLKNFFKTDYIRTSNFSIFYSALTYKIGNSNTKNSMVMEPIIAFRGVKGYKNILDAGTKFSFNSDRLNLTGIYHSTGNSTFGIGFNYNSNIGFSTLYTTGTSVLRGFSTTGDFEINLKLSF
ncbi:PorP/SprF family type IX secretion system membrane protein [Daejeonella sp.]|uniref:PorP/SprF family type IX secretion system membrane protein n=1 Tax=Daejeonella sp. TaxID=2805397 RepID=UPI002735E969|nr:PorP/SprF family type IX secretion system membrane protein [Daejeonella sp.]